MKQHARLPVSLWLCGVVALALSIHALAADKKAEKEAVEDVKFSCSQHGPSFMTLTLKLEKGNEGDKPRKIELSADGGTKWNVTIDGQPAKPGDGGNNKDTIKVRPNDELTWKLVANTHGVAFAEQDRAEALLTFGSEGKPLEDLTGILTSQSWKDFGTKRWGNKATSDAGVLAKATVKE